MSSMQPIARSERLKQQPKSAQMSSIAEIFPANVYVCLLACQSHRLNLAIEFYFAVYYHANAYFFFIIRWKIA